MTEKPSPTALAIVATRLPYIDRRALSQAWFSALHVASDGGAPRVERRASAAAVGATSVASSAHASPEPIRDGVGRATPNMAPRTNVAGAGLATQRISDARVAAAGRASYQRARSYPAFRSSLTLAVASERVQLLLRREGATLHVVAVCRPQTAEIVRRALASASAHLYVRGEAMRSSVEIATGEVQS